MGKSKKHKDKWKSWTPGDLVIITKYRKNNSFDSGPPSGWVGKLVEYLGPDSQHRRLKIRLANIERDPNDLYPATEYWAFKDQLELAFPR